MKSSGALFSAVRIGLPMSEYRVRARVFLCHNHADKPTARVIAAELLDAGHEVWLDEWEMVAGDSLVAKISEAIVDSAYLVVLLSPSSVKSGWVKRELETALTRQITGKSIKVVPCLLAPCDVPPFLEPLLYADFTASHDVGMEALKAAIQPVAISIAGREHLLEYNMDHSIDWSTAPSGETSATVWFVSAYHAEPNSMLCIVELRAAPALVRRFASLPSDLKIAITPVFFGIALTVLQDLRSAQGSDLWIMMRGASEVRHTTGVRDTTTGNDIVTMEVRARRLGNVPDRDMKYSYGDNTIRALEPLGREFREHLPPDVMRRYAAWVAANPWR